ncbi:GntR family transcriptional regulator [Campylobacter sputorum]|uniref:GntR family transcriptional regulator n=1 Tax=Campylobacter sputorum TaxID=206 RepID=UPI000B77A157|nr:GntR family transcriptional regulator [Campylobacter sputorum]ASM36617.1 transcriptional regulator, GntR family [Campylobacter sputorum bv. faecalis CCUG 20703]
MYSERPRTTTDFIVDNLSKDILSGKIKTGDRLRQNEISQKFSVSATPVREALKILAAKGFINFDPYKGAIVKELCYKDANDIYELRILLEEKIMKDAFKSYDEKNFKKAIDIQSEIEKCSDLNKWAILNAEFHKCFWENQSGRRIFSIVEDLMTSSIPYVSLSLLYNNKHISISNNEHKKIIQAYKNKDLKKLLYESISHTRKTKEILFEAIKNTSKI